MLKRTASSLYVNFRIDISNIHGVDRQILFLNNRLWRKIYNSPFTEEIYVIFQTNCQVGDLYNRLLRVYLKITFVYNIFYKSY